MSINPTVLVYVGLAAAVLLLVSLRVRFWVRQGKKLISEPGHATPHVTMAARLTRLFISTLVKRWFIGPVRVTGKQHLKFQGRLIIVLNHQTERDAIVVPAILRLLPFRALMAVTQIFGLRAPLAAWLGVIAVHHSKNPAAALRTSIEILQSEEDTSFLVFPQGALHRDNVLKREDFFDGTVMIAKKVQEKSKAPWAIVCGAVQYDRNPAHATVCQKFWQAIGLGHKRLFFGEYTYGAAVAWAEPILVSALPDNRKAAMDLVFNTVKQCSEDAAKVIA